MFCSYFRILLSVFAVMYFFASGFVTGEQRSCEGSDKFLCHDHSTCILRSFQCDGEPDCPDGSDESSSCANVTCSSEEFACRNHCVPLLWRCDGEQDCLPDGEDEDKCAPVTCPPTHFKCNSGSAFQICISTTWRCDGVKECEDGSDELNCGNHTCAEHDFACADGTKCIDKKWVCDGDSDCTDFSDEANCKHRPCTAAEFRCPNEKCIKAEWKCDGDNDCGDGGDEPDDCAVTKCDPATEFKCLTNSRCISVHWKCDGDPDCKDHSDEKNCSSATCASNQWQCIGTSHCIELDQVCDGENDCGDNSDEGSHCLDFSCSKKECSHGCRQTPKGPECYCGPGYKLHGDSVTCEDIDECQEVGKCDQLCSNVAGSYKCHCDSGYVLDPPQRCRPRVKGKPWLVMANRKSIGHLALTGSLRGFYNDLYNNFTKAIAIDLDVREGRVYWADAAHEAVYVANYPLLPGHKPDIRPVMSPGRLAAPSGLAVDWVARNLYVADYLNSRIYVCKLDGSQQASLISHGLSGPKAIAVDPRDGLLFWSDWGLSRIERAGMDGSNRLIIAQENLKWPAAFALDYPVRRLYWTDKFLDVISSMAYDGSDRRKLLVRPLKTRPLAIAVFRNNLYFSDRTRLAVIKVNKFTGNDSFVLSKEPRQPLDLKVYHVALQPQTHNPCYKNACGCSQLCLINTDRNCTCFCQTGFQLGADRKTCAPLVEFLLFARRTEVAGLSMDRSSSDAIVPLTGIGHAVGLDYDAKENKVYYSDIVRDHIKRAGLLDGLAEPVVDSIENVEGLAVDWLGRNLYWTDNDLHELAVSKLNGSFRKALFTGLRRPRAIVLDPHKGKVYWSDIGIPGKIEISSMDGSERRVLVPNLGWPNGLSIDFTTQVLYWADAKSNSLESVDLNSHRKRVVLRGLHHPFGLDVHGDFIYWTDWVSKDIKRMNKSDASSMSVFRSDLPGLMSIKVFDPKRQRGTSRCGDGLSGCSHLCLLRPGGFSCACPYGFKMQPDNKTCVDDPSVHPTPRCRVKEFLCSNGRCIPELYKCDGEDDCLDKSDESERAGCGGVTCPSQYFKCEQSNNCIPPKWRCDGGFDCGIPDTSDEANCSSSSCASDEFRCDNSYCKPRSWVCDGDDDCGDGSDEKHCGNHSCPIQEFTCLNGRCIDMEWRCDGKNDCSDNSDEHDCPFLNCTDGQFRCSPEECVNVTWRCDGTNQCRNGADEIGCPTSCRSSEFQCRNSLCIPQEYKCDSQDDCPDGSDEENCGDTSITCKPHEFLCKNHVCISIMWFCDGEDDCGDGSDEVKCGSPEPTCSANQWKCSNSSVCITEDEVCNGRRDCADGSDEGPGCELRACHADNGGCSHVCTNVPGGVLCSCRLGYKLGSDNRTCEDVDECADPGVCSQRCNNTRGSFHCSCVQGYRRQADGVHCKVTGPDRPFLYFSLFHDIRRIDLKASSVFAPVQDLSRVVGIDFDWQEQRLYWSDVGAKKISRCFFNGTGLEHLITTGLVSAEGLAVDWIGRNLYWCDTFTDRIEVATLSGHYRQPLIKNLKSPRGLVIDSRDGLLFWTDWSTKARLERVLLDGTERRELVYNKIGWPNGLTLDYANRRVYWADAKLNYIEFCDYDGSNRRTVLSSTPSFRHPYSLTLFEDLVYWTDWNRNAVLGGNKFRGDNITKLYEYPSKPMDIHVVHPARQPPGTNLCANSTCSHLCLLTSHNFSCHCPLGMRLTQDGKTCTDIEAFLLVAAKTVVRGISLNKGVTEDQMITVPQQKNAVGVDFSAQNKYVYWTDVNVDKIFRIFLNGSGYETIISEGLSQPEGIAYDWTAKNIYWTDADQNSISVARHDGSYRKVLLSSDILKPRDIVLHPVAGLMFWSDWRDDARIERARLDGSERKVIVTKLDAPLKFVNGLTIDFESGRLFFCDAGTDLLESVFLNGSDRRVVQKIYIGHAYSIAVFEQMLYWTDWHAKAIFTMRKTGGTISRLVNGLGNPFALHVFSKQRQSGVTGCSQDNGGCNQLCFPMGGSDVNCACIVGYILAPDNKTCVGVQTFLLYSTSSTIGGILLDRSQGNEAMNKTAGLQNCLSVDFLYNGSVLFYTEDRTDVIGRVNLDGTDKRAVITSGLKKPRGLAVDWVAGNLYWADSGTDLIEVSRLDGSFRTVLISTRLREPTSIAVYPAKGFLFWTDLGRSPKIERASMDGKNRILLLQDSRVKAPKGLTLDLEQDMVYIVDFRTNTLWTMDLDGSNLKLLMSRAQSVRNPFAITVFGDYVYWAERSVIKRAEKHNGTQMDTLKRGLRNVRYIRAYGQQLQPEGGPCMNNGGCEELCLAVSEKLRRCVCTSGKTDHDGRSCVNETNFIIFAEGKQIRVVALRPGHHPDLPGNIASPSNIVGLDFDFESQRVFFAANKSIMSVLLNGTDLRTVANGLLNPDGVAVDWVNKRVYWSDSASKTISSSSYNGTDKKIVIKEGLYEPRAIALLPCQKMMFWIDWGRHSIMTADSDGGNVETLVHERLGWPKGLAIDYREKRLYWADDLNNMIKSSYLNGSGRHIVLERVHQVSSITVYEGYILWTDWSEKAVFYASKFNGADTRRLVIGDFSERPMGIQVFAKERQNCTVDPCLGKDVCTHICTVRGGVAVCSCPSGMNLIDGYRCVTVSPSCPGNHWFPCSNGRCAPKSAVCDGRDNCGDGSDESPAVCAHWTCTENQFKCKSGQCINSNWLCDNAKDCRDGSDEEGCQKQTCKAHLFTCKNGHCVNQDWLCDGEDDCEDSSDEDNCPATPCAHGWVKCGTKNLCIDPAWLCDQDDDCGNNWDERPALCGNSSCPDLSEFRCAQGRCVPAHWRCDGDNDCGDNSDEVNCHLHGNATCRADQFTCANGNCIHRYFVCDRDDDCGDLSDELGGGHHCGTQDCGPTEFKCRKSSKCISMSLVCDGENNCGDGSDEHPREGCVITCSASQFRCTDNLCVPSSWHCDGDNDCRDGSDEVGCGNQTCTAEHFTCASGLCIPRHKMCDGNMDCPNGTDERAQLCSTPTPRACQPDQFQCQNGTCISNSSVCNGVNDCGDSTDERHCDTNECQRAEDNRCSQVCIDTPASYVCGCHPGFKLQADGNNCEDIDECLAFRCNQFCTNLKGSYKCTCAPGYQLQPGNHHICKAVNSSRPARLLFSSSHEIRLIRTDASHEELVVNHTNNAVSIDYDSLEERVYWSESLQIKRAFLDGTGIEVIVGLVLVGPDGLAVDWVGRNLYFTDTALDNIFVCSLEGHYKKTLIVHGLKEPRALVVDPSEGFLYYTDWATQPHIGRVGLDGSNHSKIIQNKLGLPKGLTMCHITKKLFWVDAKFDRVEFSDTDGRNRHLVPIQRMRQPFGVSVFEDFIYWTDWLTINKAHKWNGTQHTILHNSSHKLMGIQIVHPSIQPRLPSPCSGSPCFGLCLLTPSGGYQCACPDEFHLANDGRTCLDNCSNNDFVCSNYKCIPRHWRCDGDSDCGDGSDETTSCPPRHCKAGMFQCDNSTCVSILQICDDHKNCPGGQDEMNCPVRQCENFQFRCANRVCVLMRQVCDGHDDCGDGSDEQQCEHKTCLPDLFTCANGRCVQRGFVCDGDHDCGDGSDESLQLCKNFTCPGGSFQCNSSRHCIPQRWTCDGDYDCEDHSDETHHMCAETSCAADSFHCRNMRCVPRLWVCDSEDDCHDGSDEEGCAPKTCSVTQFSCSSGRCISADWQCDQDNDCGDGSDEIGCDNHTCRVGEFRCLSGNCIAGAWKCDGDRDCADASDEQGCTSHCPVESFQCSNNVCINKLWLCDGQDDCGDNSDETIELCVKHRCLHNQFRCANHRCIPKWQECDKKDDCGDGSDEVKCTHASHGCIITQFKCANRKCIPNKVVCDGYDDCGDASDELHCKQNRSCEVQNGGCEHTCSAVGEIVLCTCKRGYKLAPSSRTCEDIDECAEFGSCTQRCVNTKGSFKCWCAEGFISDSGQNSSCRARGSPPALLFPTGGEIRRLSMDGTGVGAYTAVTQGEVEIGALDVWWSEGLVYWTDLQNKTIKRARIPARSPDLVRQKRSPHVAASTSHDLYIPIASAQGFAVDWIGRNIYWTDAVNHVIAMATADGRYHRTIMKSLKGSPKSLVLDPVRGRLYWSEVGYQPSIQSANMDGGYITTLVSKQLEWPSGLALDFTSSRLFFCDTKTHRVESVLLPSGADRQSVRRVEWPSAIAVHGDHLFVTSSKAGKVYKLDKLGRSAPVVLLEGLRRPLGIQVHQEQQQQVPEGYVNHCAPGVNNCSHLCIPTSTRFKCVCPNGDSSDAETCMSPTKLPLLPPACWLGACGAGICQDIKGKVSCLCPPEFTGPRCENSVQFSTTLPPSYTTRKSTSHACNLSCWNGGVCVLHKGKPLCNCSDDTVGPRCEQTCISFRCTNGGTCEIKNRQLICRCRPGFRYHGDGRCLWDLCSNYTACGDRSRCFLSNGKPLCKCEDGVAESCEPKTSARSTETAQLVVPLVMASLVLVAVAVILYCRRRSSMKHAKYSGVSVQVGNPSFLYEDMLDEDSTAGNPDFSWNDSHKATNFSNPVYESVFHADSSVGTDLYEGEHKVSFRNGRVDFSNPVYEALFARERRVKSDPSLKGSTTTLKSTVELSSSQESNC